MLRIFTMLRFVALLGVAASVQLSVDLRTAIRAFLMVASSLDDLGRETTVKGFLIGNSAFKPLGMRECTTLDQELVDLALNRVS